MRFDLVTASISPGAMAPLVMMVGGLFLAVIGLIFLALRRRKGAKPSKKSQSAEASSQAVEAQDGLDAVQAAAEAAPEPTPAPAAPAGRRRSLVGGAERDQGTPSGEVEEPVPNEEPNEFEAKEEVEADFEEVALDDDHGADDAEPEFDEDAWDEPEVPELDEELAGPGIDGEVEPEWVESDASDPGSDLELADVAAGVAGGAGIAAGAAGVAALATADTDETGAEETSDYELVSEEPVPLEVAPIEAAPEEPASAEVEAARKSPIVFRQFLPQSPGEDGLSFYGGQPIGPADFQWPRERGNQGGAPLQFLMQWDCAQLSEQDPTGLLPQDGVLYCFVNCDRDDAEDFLSSHAFVHHRGSSQAWKPVDIPEDAGPALGKTAAFKLAGCTDQVADADAYVPRVMPRFPFAPIAFEYPSHALGDRKFWSNDAAQDALLEVQKSGVAASAEANGIANLQDEGKRPFPAFPHDFGAIRVLASRMIAAVQDPDEAMAEALYTGLSPEEREAQFDAWREEAKELYLLGTQRAEGHRLEGNISDDIWSWFNERRSILGSDLGAIVVEAVDLSLSVSSEALGSIPAKWIDKAMDAHALAREYEGAEGSSIHASVPARMFGPPSFGGDANAGLLNDAVLLLELPSGAGPCHDFGGKLLQYWITPDDLAAGKFDAVKSVVIEG